MNDQQPERRGPGRPREKQTEYAITHHGNTADSAELGCSPVYPPKGEGWSPLSLAASYGGTHVLWRRTVDVKDANAA